MEALRDFGISSVEFSDVTSIMEEIEFRGKSMRMAKAKNVVERDKGKRSNPCDVIARSVMGEAFNIFFDSGRTYIRYVAKKLIKQRTFKSDLVMGMINFDYSVLFHLPRLQATDCYTRLFQSFTPVGGWREN